MESLPIPDEDLLFFRIHKAQIITKGADKGLPGSGNFAHSANWGAHANREQTVEGAKIPEDIAGVASIRAGSIRKLGVEVRHTPEADNPAHVELGARSREQLAAMRQAVVDYWRNPRCDEKDRLRG